MNSKSILSEYCHKSRYPLPIYETKLSYFDRDTNTNFFSSSVKIGDKAYSSSYTWKNKKDAEKDCAAIAYSFLSGKEFSPSPTDLKKSTDRIVDVISPNIVIWVDLDQSINFIPKLESYSLLIKQIRYFCSSTLRDKVESLPINKTRDTVTFVPSFTNMADSYLTYDLYRYLFTTSNISDKILIISKDKFVENIKIIVEKELNINLEIIKSLASLDDIFRVS